MVDSEEKKVNCTVIVPVYNEKNGIKDTIDDLVAIREKSGFKIDIIAVNDGSNDGTGEVLDGFSSKDITVIHHPRNMGYGAAIKTGIRSCGSSYVAITDADGTYPNKRILEFFGRAEREKLDMVVGSRTGKNVNIQMIRRPAKWILNMLANYLLSRKIPDLNSGLRVMKREVVEKFVAILPNGFSLTTTITLALLTNEYKVVFIPIEYSRRIGASKIRPIRDTLTFVQLIVRTTLYFNPLKIFFPFSLLLVLLGIFIIFTSWYFTGKIMDVTFGICLISAVIAISIGMLADLINKRVG